MKKGEIPECLGGVSPALLRRLGGGGLAMQKIAEDDRGGSQGRRRRRASWRSTPSAIIRVIVDNLFRGNRGGRTTWYTRVAGNLVNVHIRIKSLVPMGIGVEIEENEHGRREDASRTQTKSSCRTRSLVQLFSLCYVISAATGFFLS
jgi:hypothetical protein